MKTYIKYKEYELIYNTPNNICKWRAKTLFKKEPNTIRWLNTLTKDDILWDVGANIGMYSIYAAIVSKCKVFAFEPESQNFAILNQNIISNNVDNLIQSYCISINDKIGIDKLKLSSFKSGSSFHTIGQDNFVEKYIFNQGTISVTLDWLLEQEYIIKPTHIKIDVDGIEHKIINGSINLLKLNSLKELLIEIDTNNSDHREIINKLKSLGFIYNEQQVMKAMRKNGKFIGVSEYIFKRN